MSAILMQSGKLGFADQNGRPLVGGKVTFYSVGTNTLKDTWQDVGQTVLNTNPVILDARGEASIYGSGAYRQVLRDANNNLIWDQVIPDLFETITSTVESLYQTSSVQVLNIAAVRALNKNVYKNAETRGYYAAGDMGAGKYYLDSTDVTTADNGGTVIVATDGGRWKLVHNGEVSLRQFGCKLDFATDDTTQLNKAIAWAVAAGGDIRHPGGVCKVTSTVNLPGSFRMFGAGVDTAYRLSMAAQTKYGSWFYLAHTGKGFVLSPTTTGTGNTNGLWFEKFGTIRDQPAVATGWAPTNHDYDFHLSGYGSADLIDIVPLNATRAFYNELRANLVRCKGQAFMNWMTFDNNYDTIRVSDCHQWPFWDETPIPIAYSRDFLTAYAYFRADNPIMSDCFSFAHQVGLYFATSATGSASRFKGSNIDLDNGRYGLFCQSSLVGIQISNISCTGSVGVTGNIGIYVDGPGNSVELKGCRLTNLGDQGVYIIGNNSRVSATDLWVETWNVSNTAKPAVACDTLSSFRATNPVRVLRSLGNNAVVFDGAGVFRAPLGSGTSLTATTDGLGRITITHKLQSLPTLVNVQSYAAARYHLAVTNRTDTTFVVTVTDSNTGNPVASGTVVPFGWDAIYVTPNNAGFEP